MEFTAEKALRRSISKWRIQSQNPSHLQQYKSQSKMCIPFSFFKDADLASIRAVNSVQAYPLLYPCRGHRIVVRACEYERYLAFKKTPHMRELVDALRNEAGV